MKLNQIECICGLPFLCLLPLPLLPPFDFLSELILSNVDADVSGNWQCHVTSSRGNSSIGMEIVVLETSALYCSAERVTGNKGDFRCAKDKKHKPIVFQSTTHIQYSCIHFIFSSRCSISIRLIKSVYSGILSKQQIFCGITIQILHKPANYTHLSFFMIINYVYGWQGTTQQLMRRSRIPSSA